MNPLASGESAQKAYLQLEQTLQTISLEESISRLKDFIRQFPDFAQAHNDLAVMYYRAGNKLLTLGHYEKAVRINPTSTFRKNLASFYFVEMGWVDDAILIYTDILAKSPNDTEVLTALGIISTQLDRNSEARTFFTRLVDLEPWNHDVRTLLAKLDSPPASDSGTKTVAPVTATAQISPTDLDAVLADLRKTISNIEKQDLPVDLYANAQTLLNQGDERGAVRELEKLIQSQPTHAVAHNDLGVLYQRLGILPKSQYHHELAVKEDPANATFRKNLAGLYFAELGKTDDAIYLLTEILRTNPNDVETLTGLARIATAIGRTNEASTFVQKVTELEPWNEDAKELLSQIQGNNNFFLTSS
ncbi:MAG: tetratricopeptide repeat protein [Geobacteraceae bacterium]|nr:tetratricopeptide repeat protein [Geobacteraceae bacterium]